MGKTEDRAADFDLERNADGSVKKRVVELPLQECELTFMTAKGEAAQPGDGSEISACHFLVKHPSIDELCVTRVELVLDYAALGPMMVKVTLVVRAEEPATA